MASAVLYLRTNSCNPAYTGVPYRDTGRYSDCSLLQFRQCCTLLHLPLHLPLMCGIRMLSVRLHSSWPFVPHGYSRSHICHPADSSSGCHGGFGHRPPLSQACFRHLDAVCPASSRTAPIRAVPVPAFVVSVLPVSDPSASVPDRRACCNT